MKHPDKWRETCDPFSLPYQKFTPTEILGYPHAGNDVFHAKGMYDGRQVTAFIKAARRPDVAIEREADILRALSPFSLPCLPEVIDGGLGEKPFSVTLEMQGERLSVILGENEQMQSMTFMSEYGAALAKLHSLPVKVSETPERRFFHRPTKEKLEEQGLLYLDDFFSKPPGVRHECFCHGDFHYANVLWDNGHISAMLDFELAGMGNRDFDIAWAIFRRPGQRFMRTQDEVQEFLRGYASVREYDADAVRYYMAQCYVYFLHCGDEEYDRYILDWLKNL